MLDLASALIASGWLASSHDWPSASTSLKLGDDLLPMLAKAAQRLASLPEHTQQHRSATALIPLLNQTQQNGAALTLGWPSSDDRPLEKWLGPRLLWWPRGVPEGRRVAWISSRLGRAIDERPDWFAVLRSATAKLDPQRDLLLTASGTTVDRFLERAAILFGIHRLRVHLDERRTLVDWLTRLRRQLWRSFLSQDVAGPAVTQSEVFVSPSGGWSAEDGSSSDLPLSDRVLIAVADQVFALQVRPNGNLHQLLRERLLNSDWPTASVWLALGETLVPSDVASELQSLGAIGWWLFVADAASVHPNDSATIADASCVGHGGTINRLTWPDGDYFVHWTRRQDGPWPDQSEANFIDELLLSREATSHSAFAALSRIVQQRRLIASATGIRGETAVVSFSANPLYELTKQRTFRTHRGRWDCEAYGLCLRREWLQSRGAKPVIYGDDDLWTSLPDSNRAFFQLKTTRSRRGAKLIDWSREAEWRVPNDLDLSEAGREDVLLFAPTEDEARQLAAISPWPVLALPTSQNPSATPATTPHC